MCFAEGSGRSTPIKSHPAETLKRLSFEQLDGLYNFALHQSSDAATAEEIVVQTYVRASARFEQLPEGRSPVVDPAASGDREVVTAAEANAPSNPAWIVLDQAEDHLVELLFALTAANAAAVRDTAFDYFNAVAISNSDKAMAAFVTANALANLGDTDARIWAQRAVDLDSSDRSYRDLLTRLGGGSS